MKVLFIGGTGIISSACTQLAVERGIDITLLNRGGSIRPIPDQARQIKVDFHNFEAVKRSLKGLKFDVVVDWIAYTPADIDRDIQLFRDITNQYIFISSASAYQKPVPALPITEETPLNNPYWEYSRNKIACEKQLHQAQEEEGFPVTIVRPSHTYDRTYPPIHGRYTAINRMLTGKKVLIHGDGTSIWTLTHHKDFAKGFNALLGNPEAIGETYHITSNEWLTWDQIHRILGNTVGVEPQIVHAPSEVIAEFDAEWGASLLGDKTHSVIFDNSKIRKLAPDFNPTIKFEQGAQEIIAWHDENPEYKISDPHIDELMDTIIEKIEQI